jgi:hypothetical protein
MLKWLTSKPEVSEMEAENKLLCEKWTTYSGYLDLEKLKQYAISVKSLLESQSKMEYNFTQGEFEYIMAKGNLSESSRFKKAVRNGIPLKYFKDLILKMFFVDFTTLKENYKTRFLSIFKNRDPKNIGDHVPYCSYFFTFEENLPLNYLNQLGQESIKEILWLLYSVVPNIEFCPMLIKLISLSLIFMTREECFAVIKNIIITDYSNKNLSKIRFRLRFNYEENKRLIQSFIESYRIISRNSGKEILKKFEKLGFDIEILIEDMFFNIFIGYLNFNFLNRIFLLYLNEGVKILFRVAYALLKSVKNDILDINSNELVISTIKHKAFEIKDESTFFSSVFYFKLNSSNNRYEEIKIVNQFKPDKLVNYYIPTINGESNIMTDDEIFSLWNIFPESYCNKDAKLIYSTDYQGFSLSQIYDTCSDTENSCFNSFVLILTKKSQIFGVMMSLPFDRNRTGFYKPAYTALFVLRPYIKRFDVSQVSDRIIMCGEEKIVIGLGKEGPALELEKDLILGFSYKSEIFNSPSLCNDEGNSFEIAKIEVFILY